MLINLILIIDSWAAFNGARAAVNPEPQLFCLTKVRNFYKLIVFRIKQIWNINSIIIIDSQSACRLENSELSQH